MTSAPTDTHSTPPVRAVSAAHNHVIYRARALPRQTDPNADPHQVLMDRVWHDWDQHWTGAYGAGHVTLLHHTKSNEWAVVWSDLATGWSHRTPGDRRAALVENTCLSTVAPTMPGLLTATARKPGQRASDVDACRLAVAYALTRCQLPKAASTATLLALGAYEGLGDRVEETLVRKADVVLFSGFTSGYATRFHTLMHTLGPVRDRSCSTTAPKGCWACNEALGLAFTRQDEPDMGTWWDSTVQTPVAGYEGLLDVDFAASLVDASNAEHPGAWTLTRRLTAVAASFGDPTMSFWDATDTLVGDGWELTDHATEQGHPSRPTHFAIWSHPDNQQVAVSESFPFHRAPDSPWEDGDVSDRLVLLSEWAVPHWTTSAIAHEQMLTFRRDQ